MRRAALALACLLAAGPALAEAGDSDEPAFVEVVAARTTVFVHEPVRLRLRVGFDAAFFAEHAIPTFRQRLDVPVQIVAPWMEDLPGTRPLRPLDRYDVAPGDDADIVARRSLALNDGAADAEDAAGVVREGRAFTVVELERRFAAERPGEIVVSAPSLRFASASRFDEDLVSGRVPADRREWLVRGAPITLHVLALPVEGRPPEFRDAIGRFTVAADVDRRTVAAGETVKVALRIEGEGNLETLEPPRLDGLPGFHVYGVIDDRGLARRTIEFDVAPLRDDVRELPAIPFAFLDPGPPAAYRVVRTSPIPLAVRPAADGSHSKAVEGSPGAQPGESRGPDPTLVSILLVVAVVVAIVCALGVGVFLRRRTRRAGPIDPEATRAREAAAAFRAHASRPGADVAAAFAEFLAAHLRCAPAAVIGPDLATRLKAAGVASDLAARAASALEGLVAARYGGRAASGAEVAALVERLDGPLLAGAPRRP